MLRIAQFLHYWILFSLLPRVMGRCFDKVNVRGQAFLENPVVSLVCGLLYIGYLLWKEVGTNITTNAIFRRTVAIGFFDEQKALDEKSFQYSRVFLIHYHTLSSSYFLIHTNIVPHSQPHIWATCSKKYLNLRGKLQNWISGNSH